MLTKYSHDLSSRYAVKEKRHVLHIQSCDPTKHSRIWRVINFVTDDTEDDANADIEKDLRIFYFQTPTVFQVIRSSQF